MPLTTPSPYPPCQDALRANLSRAARQIHRFTLGVALASSMNTTPKPAAPIRPMRTAIRHITLACAAIGLLLSLLWPIAELVFGRSALDHIPNWLGFVLLFIVACYAFWEIRLSFQHHRKASKRMARHQQIITTSPITKQA